MKNETDANHPANFDPMASTPATTTPATAGSIVTGRTAPKATGAKIGMKTAKVAPKVGKGAFAPVRPRGK